MGCPSVYASVLSDLARYGEEKRNSPMAIIALYLAERLDAGLETSPATAVRELRQCLRALNEMVPDAAVEFTDEVEKQRIMRAS